MLVGAALRVDEGFAEAGRAGDTAGSALAIGDGLSEIGILSTFPRLIPSGISLLVSPDLTSPCAVSSMGLKEATEVEGRRCRFELL